MNNVHLDDDDREILEIRDKLSKMFDLLHHDFKTDRVTLPIGICSLTIIDSNLGGDTCAENG